MFLRLVIVCFLCFFLKGCTASGAEDVSDNNKISPLSSVEQVIEAAHMRGHPVDLTTPLRLESPSHPGSKSLALKKRLRPGLASLGRGVVRATLSKDAILSRARGLLSSNSLLNRRETRQSPGVVAGALAYGLTALPFMTLPLLFMGPMAYKKIFNREDEKEAEEEKLSQTLNQIFNVASEILTANLNASASPSTSKFAQALGLNPSNLSEEPNKPNSAAAAAVSGDALFSPGLFNPNSNFIKNGKYKQYVFKEGVVSTTTTKRPKVSSVTDPVDALFERKSEGKSADSIKVLGETESPKDNMASIAKDVLKTVSDGIRKFELEKTECKERLVCEVSQKYSGSSFKSWATALMHVLDVDTRVEKSKVGKNAVLRTIYRGARSSLTPDKTCADLFPGCA